MSPAALAIMFKKILCAIDFSPGSQRAMQLAARVAKDDDAELVIAHAWHMPPIAYAGEYSLPFETVGVMQQDAERGLKDAARELAGLGVKRVATKLLNGVPWAQIVETLEADRTFDVVVMGTHGRTALARVLLGSVAEKVVRHAPCSVLTTRPDGELGLFRHVLCPIDFSESSRHAAELGIELAARHDGKVTLVHVIEVPVLFRGEALAYDSVVDVDKRSTHLLLQWAADLSAKTPISVTTRIEIGRAGASLITVLENDPSVTLVVVGSHGRTGIRRALLGSVAEKIVRHSTCPVLVARRRDEHAR